MNTDKKNELTLNPDKSAERQQAEFAQSNIATNTQTIRAFAAPTNGLVDITESIAIMNEKVQAVNDGDLNGVESMLTAQATSLNVIFNELARRACLNMGEYVDATDTYMRLALKAQMQCKATLETLVEMKCPRPFVRQTNISNGHQQVNNYGEIPTIKQSGGVNELYQDIRASGIKSKNDSVMEALGEVDGRKD